MTSQAPSRCCVTGFRHDGTPTGTYQTIGSYECYTSTPASGNTSKAILLLTDVLGHKFTNSQLLADRFAANGYFVVVPDLFHGDPIPLNAPEDMSIMDWLHHGSPSSPSPSGHLPPRIDPVISSVTRALRSPEFGVQRLGGVGYCLGAKYAIRFLRENGGALDVGFVAHPSFVTAEELAGVTGPLSIAAGGDDPVFPASRRRETEDILGGKGVPWQLCLFGGVDHGFAVRCNVGVRRQRFAMEQAFFQAVAWFGEFL